MRVLGLISGTSHDGIDCAVVDFVLDNQGELRARIEHVDSVPYSAGLRSQLVAALPPAQVDLHEVAILDTRIGQEFAAAASTAIGGRAVDLICSHGQTVYHWVEHGRVHGTLQIGQPAWLAEQTGVPVIADVRSRDVAAGGQGAPLVPILDQLLLAAEPGASAALNLGGISNATIQRPDHDPIAFDMGPANALIDAAVQMTGAHRRGFDVDGLLAAAGTVSEVLLQDLLAEPYYAASPPKSTGKELFNQAYVAAALERTGSNVSAQDLIATLSELTARTVADALAAYEVTTVVASGGGAANPVIMGRISELLPETRVVGSDDYGIPSDAKEAVAFALIGWLSAHGLPAAVPTATGAESARVLGAIIPGNHPLRLPEPLRAMPTRLIMEPAQQPVTES